MSHIWSAFVDLCSGRQSGINGLNPLSYSEIESYTNLTNTCLTPNDVSAIKQLDTIYLKVMNG